MGKIITMDNRTLWSRYSELLGNFLRTFNSINYKDQELLLPSVCKYAMEGELRETNDAVSPFNERWESLNPALYAKPETYWKYNLRRNYGYDDCVVYLHIISVEGENALCTELYVTKNSVYTGFYPEKTLSAKNIALSISDGKYISVTKEEFDKEYAIMDSLKINYDECREDNC